MGDLLNKKHKIFPPNRETLGKMKDQKEVIVISDDEDEVSVATEGSCVWKLLQFQQSDDKKVIEKSTRAGMKIEESDGEKHCKRNHLI